MAKTIQLMLMMKTFMKTEDCHEENSVDHDDDENSQEEWRFTMMTILVSIAIMRMKICTKTEGCYGTMWWWWGWTLKLAMHWEGLHGRIWPFIPFQGYHMSDVTCTIYTGSRCYHQRLYVAWTLYHVAILFHIGHSSSTRAGRDVIHI